MLNRRLATEPRGPQSQLACAVETKIHVRTFLDIFGHAALLLTYSIVNQRRSQRALHASMPHGGAARFGHVQRRDI